MRRVSDKSIFKGKGSAPMSQIGREYAEALFSLACESGAEKEMMSALDRISDILEGSPEYRELLSSPAIPAGERAELVDQAFRGKIPEHAVSFVQLLCEKRRMADFPFCAEEYKKLLEAKNALTEAIVTSAVPLSADEISALKTKLEKISGRNVSVTCHVDAELLGGMIVEMDGKIMDGSLRHRLRELKDVMSK